MFNSIKLTTNLWRSTYLYSTAGSYRNIGILKNYVLHTKPSLRQCSSLMCRHQSKNTNSTILKRFQKQLTSHKVRCSGTTSSTPNKKLANKLIGYWLIGCSGMVFVAVVLGGVTRLTESGLSMVTWKLLGEQWPKNDEEWSKEFALYQQYPEFLLKNPNMTVSEFKTIFFMEYLHRMWGRAIGAVFALPAIYFWSRGYMKKPLKIRTLVYGALIGLQGLMGWYMVKSGLEDRFHSAEDVPRVSQYRLAAHLSAAFVLYVAFLWSALHHLLPAQTIPTITKSTLRFRRLAHAAKGMVFFTALSGAFVAGLDAGLIYNTFPKMADSWIPSDILALSPTIRNFFDNPTTVQFDHRILGISTLTLLTTIWFISRRRTLPPRAYYAAAAVGIMGWIQVLLGVTTLLTYVPIPLAAGHQSGSLLLLSTTMWLSHELKLLKYIPK